MPGSPPIRIAERFVAPPPKTRSNSVLPVEILSHSIGSTEESGTGVILSDESGILPYGREEAPASSVCSSKVFHSPHSGQRPSQRGCVKPQFEHLYTTFAFFFATSHSLVCGLLFFVRRLVSKLVLYLAVRWYRRDNPDIAAYNASFADYSIAA